MAKAKETLLYIYQHYEKEIFILSFYKRPALLKKGYVWYETVRVHNKLSVTAFKCPLLYYNKKQKHLQYTDPH